MNAAKLAKAAKILKNAGCSEVYVFGSQATGRANVNSDIDLGVRGLSSASIFGLHYDLEQALRTKVDLVDFDYQKDFFDLLLPRISPMSPTIPPPTGPIKKPAMKGGIYVKPKETPVPAILKFNTDFNRI